MLTERPTVREIPIPPRVLLARLGVPPERVVVLGIEELGLPEVVESLLP